MNDHQYYFEYLIGKGVPAAHARGMVANMPRESGMNPAAVGDNGNSIGLFQHNGPRRRKLLAFAKAAGKDWRDPYVQMDYALTEPDTAKYLNENFRGGEDASEWFLRHWERPANPDQDWQKTSRDYAELFGGGVQPAAAGGGQPAYRAVATTQQGGGMGPLAGSGYDDEFIRSATERRAGIDAQIQELMARQDEDPLLGRGPDERSNPFGSMLYDYGEAMMRAPTGWQILQPGAKIPGINELATGVRQERKAASRDNYRRQLGALGLQRGVFQDELTGQIAERAYRDKLTQRQRAEGMAMQQAATEQAQRQGMVDMALEQGREDVARAIGLGVPGAEKELIEPAGGEPTASEKKYRFLIEQGKTPEEALEIAFKGGVEINTGDVQYGSVPAGFSRTIDPETGVATDVPNPGTIEFKKRESAARGVEASLQSLDDLSAIVKEKGEGLDLVGDQATQTRIGVLYQQLMASVADLNNAGVLQPGEIETIKQGLPDPRDKMTLRDKDAIIAAYDELRKRIQRVKGSIEQPSGQTSAGAADDPLGLR